jgi:hypothetical protein
MKAVITPYNSIPRDQLVNNRGNVETFRHDPNPVIKEERIWIDPRSNQSVLASVPSVDEGR